MNLVTVPWLLGENKIKDAKKDQKVVAELPSWGRTAAGARGPGSVSVAEMCRKGVL